MKTKHYVKVAYGGWYLMSLFSEVYSIINGQWETCLAPHISILEPPAMKEVSLLLEGTNGSYLDYLELITCFDDNAILTPHGHR